MSPEHLKAKNVLNHTISLILFLKNYFCKFFHALFIYVTRRIIRCISSVICSGLCLKIIIIIIIITVIIRLRPRKGVTWNWMTLITYLLAFANIRNCMPRFTLAYLQNNSNCAERDQFLVQYIILNRTIHCKITGFLCIALLSTIYLTARRFIWGFSVSRLHVLPMSVWDSSHRPKTFLLYKRQAGKLESNRKPL